MKRTHDQIEGLEALENNQPDNLPNGTTNLGDADSDSAENNNATPNGHPADLPSSDNSDAAAPNANPEAEGSSPSKGEAVRNSTESLKGPREKLISILRALFYHLPIEPGKTHHGRHGGGS